MAFLETSLAKLVLKNPIMMASGTAGYDDEYDCFFDVEKLGAIVTKGLTLEKRKGNESKRIFEMPFGGMINRIGLENIGIDEFLSKEKKHSNLILNIAGSSVEDYVEIAKKCEKSKIRAIELNLSCPNVTKGCIEFGVCEKALSNLVSRVREQFSGCLMIKLTPNVTSIEKLAVECQKSGADAICAINTVKALHVELDFKNKKFEKQIYQGGLSGKCILPIALLNVYKIFKEVDIPIVGLGGISSFEDVLKFFSVGAKCVQIGTSNFTNPRICFDILEKLEIFMNENGFETIDDLRKELLQ